MKTILTLCLLAVLFPQVKLAEPAFTVAPAKFMSYSIEVYRPAHVVGRFRAQGGSGNDIRVMILDADQLENWKNGHQTNTYYNSQKVTVGTINVGLNRGTYYLVFDNTFSAVSNKAVTTDIQLQ